MKDVKIKEAQENVDPAVEIMFEDLRHWHAHKLVNYFKSREKISG
jgi:hypothetical protein